MFYVYIYLDPRVEDDVFGFKPFYVGKGSGNRCYTHLEESKNLNIQHPKLSKIRKICDFGLNPIIKIYKEFEIEQDAYICEKELIEAIGSKFIDSIKDGPLTNLKIGGFGGGCSWIWTEEKRREFSKRLQGQNKGNKNGMYGKPSPRRGIKHNPNTIKKMKESMKKRFGGETNTSKEIFLFDIEGNFIKSFKTVLEASIEIGCNKVTILSSAQTQGQRISFGFRWSFNKEIEKKLKIRKININSIKNLLIADNTKMIQQIDKHTLEIIETFASCQEAIKKTGIKHLSDSANPNKPAKTAGGYIWKYI